MAYLNQLGLQVESLMERHLLKALGECWEVHEHCRYLENKQENIQCKSNENIYMKSKLNLSIY